MDLLTLFQLYSNSDYSRSFKLTQKQFEYLYQASQSPIPHEQHSISKQDEKLMQVVNATTFSQLIRMFNRMVHIIQHRAKFFINE